VEQWYSNKELFEQIMKMRDEIISLRSEMKETRDIIRKYNGLREELYNIESEIEKLKAAESGKTTVLDAIREWGGWIVAILMLIVNIIQN